MLLEERLTFYRYATKISWFHSSSQGGSVFGIQALSYGVLVPCVLTETNLLLSSPLLFPTVLRLGGFRNSPYRFLTCIGACAPLLEFKEDIRGKGSLGYSHVCVCEIWVNQA